MTARPSRLAAMLANPGDISFHDATDLRLLAAMTQEDRAELRAAARSGAGWDRTFATVALARLRDEAAGDLLADLVADPARWEDTASALRIGADESGSAALAEHEDLLAPWLLEMLGSDDEAVRRSAAATLGILRIAAAGPRLLRLAQSAIDELPSSEERTSTAWVLLNAAAGTSPGREVADQVRRWLDLPIDHAQWPADALAAIAARAEPGVYEWALERCADRLMNGDTRCTVDALAGRGRESLPLLEKVALESPHRDAPGKALEAIAALDSGLAERHAREHWTRFPEEAIEVLSERYRGSADPEVAELVVRIVKNAARRSPWDFCDALVRIGGPIAMSAATRAVEKLAERDEHDEDLPRLRSLVTHAAPARDLAAELTVLGLVPEWAAEVADELAPGPVSPYDLLLAVFERAGRSVDFDPDSGSYPPSYVDLLAEFVGAAGGTVEVSDVELVGIDEDGDAIEIDEEESEGFRFSFVHGGSSHSWDTEDNGDYLDIEVTAGMAHALRPADPSDPRRFVEVGNASTTYLFADPEKLSEFCKRNGIDEAF
ncbi:hypothetical protein AB0L88_34650 [Saccharopolyspora shandongensis]|uniref:HEAT repeat domain-containing protein n=1 Tax=Saccharopolyspora shandongensis TaxID=418495 RepID=UPI0011600184|nr:hypothetical protein [Saccharopolyspora shandongensis]